MSVTIVSTPPTPAQAVPAENTPGKSNSDDLALAPDFASLLLGQGAAIVADALPKIEVKKDSTPTDPSVSDAATLLAALGMVAPEPARTAEAAPAAAESLPPGVIKADKSPANALPALPAMQDSAATERNPKLENKTEAVTAQTPLNLTVADDKPAKFAVPAAPVIEAVVAKSTAPDTPQNSQPTLAINANTPPPRHEIALSVPTPVRDQNWVADFGQKVVWLAANDKQQAQLTLNPPQMGPIEISLSLDKANATASFVSANAEVRNAIEAAMPRLREMFASAGIDLGQTNVSAESFRQQAGHGEGHRPTAQGLGDNAILGADSAGSARARSFTVRQGNGMVDIFA